MQWSGDLVLCYALPRHRSQYVDVADPLALCWSACANHNPLYLLVILYRTIPTIAGWEYDFVVIEVSQSLLVYLQVKGKNTVSIGQRVESTPKCFIGIFTGVKELRSDARMCIANKAFGAVTATIRAHCLAYLAIFFFQLENILIADDLSAKIFDLPYKVIHQCVAFAS